MNALERAELYRAFLAEEGYAPKIDEDGDVVFKCEGMVFFISVDDDAEYFRLVCADFWSIDSHAERDRVVHTAAKLNASMKVAKVYPVKDDTWASVEMFCSPPDAVLPTLSRAMRCLRGCVARFFELMRNDA